ncbi:MAG TPA: MIP family channel protein [Pirellulales bacterium]|jgi:MIP family channel proteins
MLRGTARECAAEFLGTLVLVTFGVAVVAQVVLSEKSHGQYLSINLGWGLAVTMGVFIAGGISGAHLNPAVTLAAAMCQDFPWRKVLPFCAAQVAGAFVASAIVFAAYHEALVAFAGTTRDQATAGIWATYPQSFLTLGGGLIDQVVGTALLVAVIFAISDKRNLNPTAAQGAIAVGLLVLLIGMTFGFNAGYAINPARDFGPRLFTFVAGWGGDVFRWGNGWWWVPIVGPLVGGVLGGWIYNVFIGRRHPPLSSVT